MLISNPISHPPTHSFIHPKTIRTVRGVGRGVHHERGGGGVPTNTKDGLLGALAGLGHSGLGHAVEGGGWVDEKAM